MSAAVHVVDDDAAVRRGLGLLLTGAGFEVRSYASAEAFLAESGASPAGCLLLDVAMPGMSGLELQAVLAARGVRLPVIFLTGHGDIPSSVRAMKDGAVEFLEKPVAGDVLIAAVRGALALDAGRHADQTLRAAAQARYATLTEREREIMALAVAGLSNKLIARRLGISHRTIEIHRARAMRKMRAASLLELAREARLCDLAPPERQAPGEG
ncbi:MAG: response regulator [Burkholderiales bacterium]|nr:response regulator [Burkholderiales bacterium]